MQRWGRAGRKCGAGRWSDHGFEKIARGRGLKLVFLVGSEKHQTEMTPENLGRLMMCEGGYLLC